MVRCLQNENKNRCKRRKNKPLNAKGRIICKNANREVNLSGRKILPGFRRVQVAADGNLCVNNRFKVRGEQSGCWTGCFSCVNVKRLHLYNFCLYQQIN